MRLGGIDVPHDHGTEGHSDADVLLHAITDAILGAAGLPDIGELFPDTWEENRGRDSGEILQLAYGRVNLAHLRLVNLDCVIACEKPKLAEHKGAIRQRIADLLHAKADQINLKAKTGEGVGPVGQQHVIEARCVALLAKPKV